MPIRRAHTPKGSCVFSNDFQATWLELVSEIVSPNPRDAVHRYLLSRPSADAGTVFEFGIGKRVCSNLSAEGGCRDRMVTDAYDIEDFEAPDNQIIKEAIPCPHTALCSRVFGVVRSTL